MKTKPLLVSFLFLALAVAGCNLSFRGEKEKIIFSTPETLFPQFTRDPNATPLPSGTPSLPPQPTPRLWPSPYNGGAGPTQVTPIPTPMPVFNAANSVTFLLIGSDKRTSSFRTDTMMIVNFQPQENILTLISIPRDLFVYIPGWKMQRINAAYQHGETANYPGAGPGLVKDTILYNLGIHIDHLAMVDFTGFINIVNTLGGIEIPVTCAYKDWMIIDPNRDAEDEDNWELVTVGPGIISMDGDLALWYARSRLRSDDFDRGRRQQEVIRAVFQQAINLNILSRIPELYTDLSSAVVTDLGLSDIVALAPDFARMSGARIRSYYINRDVVEGWRSPTGASLQIPEQPALTYMLQEALAPVDYQESVHLDTLVEIWNGTQNTNWDVLAAERLAYGGFGASLAPADNRNQTNTLLYVLSEAIDPIETDALLKLLGLPEDRLIHEPDAVSRSEYRLVLGADYNPCFKPGKVKR